MMRLISTDKPKTGLALLELHQGNGAKLAYTEMEHVWSTFDRNYLINLIKFEMVSI